MADMLRVAYRTFSNYLMYKIKVKKLDFEIQKYRYGLLFFITYKSARIRSLFLLSLLPSVGSCVYKARGWHVVFMAIAVES
jgi:hypothetical protein